MQNQVVELREPNGQRHLPYLFSPTGVPVLAFGVAQVRGGVNELVIEVEFVWEVEEIECLAVSEEEGVRFGPWSFSVEGTHETGVRAYW